ncbi:uncharacterized protein LOC100892262 [Strongylocentrotus purpuratus]|uniref:Transmembrane protein n=1 Tax=Strongylocentrotus purpuratus TaxID=7668 RepID=A0A7M7GQS5_STRPU|nr:uncharacterized protein LOC100892262 [Strongylocentrotus purpuratus]|eukprot:XP_003728828.1 PREDICTED: uncharacterized protein LOC100892262 [Strongylocentrotus purpuratus]
MYAPCVLDDETVIGIILGHADTEAYLNRPKPESHRPAPITPKEPQKKCCLPSLPSILPEVSKMKCETLREPCLKSCVILSVVFSIAGIALVVVGTVMLTRQSASSSSSGGNHQWMLILGLLIVFVAITSYLCLRNYCAYHLGEAPVKVLSIEGEELKDCQYQLMKTPDGSIEKGSTVSETELHLKADVSELELAVTDGEKSEILASSEDQPTDNVTFEDEHGREPTSQHMPSDTESDLDCQPDVEFRRQLRRMSKALSEV